MKIKLRVKRVKTIYYFLIIFVFGCSNENNVKVNFSENKFDLTTSTIISESYLQDPWDIIVLDSVLILGNQKGEPRLELYNTSGKLLKKTLSVGKGPSEILMIGHLQGNIKNGGFYVYDLFAKKVLSYNIKSLLINENYQPIEYFSLSEMENKNGEFEKLIILNDGFIGTSLSPKGRFVKLKKDGSIIKYFSDIPPKKLVNSKLSDFANTKLYSSGSIELNSVESKMASITYTAGMLDIFEFKGDGSITSIWSNCMFLPQNIDAVEIGEGIYAAHSNESRYGYPDISVTDQYIYALYSGKKFSEPDYSFGSVIHIVSWDGKKTKELHINMLLKRIAVSKDNKKIYAVAQNDNFEPEIVQIDLSTVNL